MKHLSNSTLKFAIPKKYVHLVVILSLIGFIALTIIVLIYPTEKLDSWFSLEVQEHVNPFLDWVMIAISFLGQRIVAIATTLITALLFFLFGKKRASLFVVFTLFASLVSSVIKYIVNRPRPAKDLVRVIEKTSLQSFPSGHVTFYTVFFGFLIYLMWSMKGILLPVRIAVSGISIFLIIAVAASRIYLGAHWLTDVIGGYFLGIICLYVLIYSYNSKGKIL